MIQAAWGLHCAEPLMSSGRNKRKLGEIDLGHSGPMVVSLHGVEGYNGGLREEECYLGNSSCFVSVT